MSEIEKAARVNSAKDSKDSLAWFHNKIKSSYGSDGRAKSSSRRMRDAAFTVSNRPLIGGLYFFLYDPKHKETLPWYDSFPLVIPVNFYNDGFMGINLHYTPPIVRGRILDTLMKNLKTSKTEMSYMRVSYTSIQNSLSSDVLSKCIHRYLTNHIMSDIVMVDSSEWKKAALLPVQSFVGATSQQIWRS